MNTVALGDVADFYSGGTPSKSRQDFWQGTVPWFSAKDMKKDRLTDSADHITEDAFRSTSLRKLRAGTVAIVVRGMILAHTVPVSILDVDAAINQDLKAILPRRDLDASFLAAMLRAQHATILSQVSTAAHGTKKLDTRVLENIEIPFPPLTEQRRIAAVLDHADALRAKRRQVLAHLDTLTRSIFNDMFADSEARRVDLSDIAQISSGITKGRRTSATTRTVPYLAVSNVQAGYLNMDVVKDIEATDAEIERYRLRAGDLVLTEGGDPDKLGRGTVWRDELPLCLHQNHIFRVRLSMDSPALPEYLAAYMGGRESRVYFLRAAKQTTGIASINTTQLKALPILLPPLDWQHSYLARVATVNASRAATEQALAIQDELFSSLQHRAFSGEL